MPRRQHSSIGLLVLFALAAALSAGRPFVRRAEARPAPPPAQTAPAAAPAPAPDEYQRSYRIDHYLELSDSGVARGENIYFHKCWVCHNQYQSSAPRLTELMQGGGLGADALATQIKNGGVGMPSFRSTLSEKDLADLVRYMRAGKCCFEGDILPVNPQYRASAKKWTVPNTLSGGARGRVRTPTGEPVEGVMVQLIAPNGVRTTVYSISDGN
jgi:mono/diheme cytochrome c family protein